jgi:uncharacterized protein YdhG (YjbR/CyaY superfamily)
MNNSSNFEEDLSGFPKETQIALNQIRTSIKNAAPLANEVISYGMPAFKLNGRMLVWIAAYKNHIGHYPMPSPIKAFKKDLAQYKTGKGTLRFPLDCHLPLRLVAKVVKYRMNENLSKLKAKGK